MTFALSRRRFVLLAAGASSGLAGCGGLDEVLTPDGRSADADHKSEREGGIGGTGIFGAITGRGSVLVNGQRIVTPEEFLVSSTLGRRNSGDLSEGDVVAMITAPGPDGDLIARRGSLFLPLVGPIENVGGRFTVLGVEVVADPDTPIAEDADGRPIEVGGLALGDTVAVSGLWRGEQVVATRIRRLSRAALSSVSGQVRENAGHPSIGATPVVGLQTDRGPFATAFGRYVGGVFVAARVDYSPLGVFAEPIERMVVEGFLAPNIGAPGHHLSGFGLPLDPASPIERLVGIRSLFVGGFDGDFLVETQTALPGTVAQRRLLLTP